MNITASAISLNVADVSASALFLAEHFGFREVMSQDGFASLAHDDAGFNVVFLRAGLKTFKPRSHAGAVGPGLLVVFEVDDIDAEWDRLRSRNLTIPTPIETEPWGERYFQVLDPNGVIIQLVQWVQAP
ncbi:VOC family protein [Kocuria sp. cx-455]|uniref:VOC family protein n=1 Tax=Kocuria sp. cx-455 TaxID=2771377 RepID=UPI003D75830A